MYLSCDFLPYSEIFRDSVRVRRSEGVEREGLVKKLSFVAAFFRKYAILISMKRTAFIITLIATLSLPVFAAEESTSAKVGEKAPSFTIINSDNESVSLSDFEGKNIVLVFSRAHW